MPGCFSALAEIAGPMRDLPLLGDFLGAGGTAAGERDHLDAGDVLDRLEMLDAEGALAGERDFHVLCLS